MKWSWRLGTVAGIGLYVHATFFLLIAWVGITYWLAGGSAAALSGIGFILALFACVVLHELGHALDRKSTRLNSSHLVISYAVFCLKKKNNNNHKRNSS